MTQTILPFTGFRDYDKKTRFEKCPYDSKEYDKDHLEFIVNYAEKFMGDGNLVKGFSESALELEQDARPQEVTELARSMLSSLSFPEDIAAALADAISIKFFQERLAAEIDDIPPYLSEKERRGGDWSPDRHYNAYWKVYADAGALFLDQLRRRDRSLADALTTWANRRNIPVRDVLPPPRDARTNLYGSIIQQIFGEEGIRIGQAFANRKNRRSERTPDTP